MFKYDHIGSIEDIVEYIHSRLDEDEKVPYSVLSSDDPKKRTIGFTRLKTGFQWNFTLGRIREWPYTSLSKMLRTKESRKRLACYISTKDPHYLAE